MEHQNIIEYINEHREEYIKFLQKLIQTESYNPPGNEKNITDLIETFLKEAKIEYEVYLFGENRANLIASLNPSSNRKVLLYNGHLDTVPAGDYEKWDHPPLSGFIEGGKKMYGRGTTDMKSGLAAMIISLKILKTLNVKLSGNLIINAVAEEETGGFLGTKWCVENVLKYIHCDFAVVGEYTGLNSLPKAIMVGEKGHLQIKITTHGKSAHASVPFLGNNPINIMCDIISNLDTIDNYLPEIKLPIPKEELQHNIMKNMSFNGGFEDLLKYYPLINSLYTSITTITKSCTIFHAGIKENIIPDRCEAIVNFRILPEHTVEMIMDGLRSMIHELGYRVREDLHPHSNNTFISLEVHHYTEPSYFKGWRDSKPLKNFYDIVKSVYNINPIYFLFPASADAEFFRNNNYCQETILFGPGSFRVAHSVNEYVSIEDFINSIKVYTLFALDFLK